MNKKLFLALLCSLLIFSFGYAAKEQVVSYNDAWGNEGITLLNQDDSYITLNFSIKKFSLTPKLINNEDLQTIGFAESFLPNDKGAPNVPSVSRYIAIPQNADIKVNIINSEQEVISNVDLAPAHQIPVDSSDEPLVYDKNMDIYSKDEMYPQSVVRVSEPSKMRGVDMVTLAVSPFQYNPVTKKLKVNRNIKIEVEFVGGNGHFGVDKLRSRWWESIWQQMLVNYESLPEVNYNNNYRNDDYEYLIIIPDNPIYYDWADSLKQFRTTQGINTGVVTLADIGGNNANTIENYIDGLDPYPAAILFMADYGTGGVSGNGIIAPEFDGGYADCISDNFYADVDEDQLPDIVTARMTAQTEDQLAIMVSKVLDNERNPSTNPNFYQHPITALGWQTERWFQICSESIGGFWHNELDRDQVRINAVYGGNPNTDPWSTATNTNLVLNYFGPNGQGYIPASPSALGGWTGGTATDVNDAINSGAFMLQHRDHGSTTGWGEPAYGISNMGALDNEDLVTVFSINCLTGQFDDDSECFAEAMHRHEQRALGLIAATAVSFSFVNDTYVWGMYDNFWPNFMPTFGANPPADGNVLPAFGNVAGKHFLASSNWPYNTSNKPVTYYLFHWHGGAFSSTYTQMPQNLTVVHDGALLSGMDTYSVTADLGALICLSVDGEIIGVGEGNGTFPTSISIPPQTPGNNMLITVTKQDHYRYEEEVEIIPPSGPYVIFNGYTINDSLGNNNGQADYTENITLNVTLKNVGVADANNVDATISTNDEYVTIVDSTENYDSIGTGSTLTVDDAFQLQIANNVPDQHQVFFDVSVTGTSKDSLWESGFGMTVNAPILTAGNLSISDPQGNGNGRLDPGEEANLTIEAINQGHSDIFDLVATLNSANDNVEILTSSVDIDEIEFQDTTTVVFTVQVDDNAPVGTSVPFVFEVVGGEYSVQHTYYKLIGLVIEGFETGDFTDFDWQFGGDAGWQISSGDAYEGDYCAQSEDIGNSQNAEMSVNLNVFDGEISFYRRVSSESNYDYLQFYIDDELKGEWSGILDWTEVSFDVSAGNHTFKWVYDKDYYVSSGQDCAWIDYITFPPILAPYPVFYMNPQELDFGDVYVDSTSTMQFTVQNMGSGNLSGSITTIDGYSVTVADSKGEPKNSIDYSLDMGQSKTYDLTFAPTQPQNYDGEITITQVPFGVHKLPVYGVGLPLQDTDEENQYFAQT
ncbi:MAG: hypothetical protein KGY75_01805, partial [Candidatus Cloacimonetes bacterium]|nr:hypothetical protein [Candidatus Cloacimonadota bacterium]